MIRAYINSDFLEIEEIYNLSKKDEFISEQVDIAVIPLRKDERMLDLLHASNIFIYQESRIAGFSGVKDNCISWLFVHPNFRGQGIAKKLVLHVLSTLNGSVTLNVARSNVIAFNLYKDLGFEVIEEFVGNYQSNQIAVCKMGI